MNITNITLPPGAAWEPSPYITSPSPAAVALPILAFAAIVLDLPCLFWHISNRNAAASMLVAWVILQNIIVIIGAATWSSDDVDSWWHGQGYCDVAVKLDFASGSAIVGATLCIIRALAQALDCHRPILPGTESSKAGKIRQATLLYGLCVGMPIYMVIAAFIVQSNRYYIYAVSGCVMAEWHSVLTIVLCYIPVLVVMTFSCYYSVLVILRLYRYKRDIASVLASTQSGLSTKRFARLAGLSLSLIAIYTPALAYIIASEQPSAGGYFAFDWSVVHDPARWNTIILVPTNGAARIDRWFRVSIGFVVFACFGFGKIKIRTSYSHFLDRIGVDRAAYNVGRNPNAGLAAGPSVAPNDHSFHISILFSKKSFGSIKGHARCMVSKLSLRSRSSSGSTPTDVFSSSVYSQPTPLIMADEPRTALPSIPTPAHLSFQHQRPTGVLEEALYEQDLADSRRVSGRIVDVQVTPILEQPPPTYQQTVATGAPARSRLASISHWVSENVRPMGITSVDWVSGHATGTFAGARHGYSRTADSQSDVELTDFERMKNRAYEDFVVGRLT